MKRAFFIFLAVVSVTGCAAFAQAVTPGDLIIAAPQTQQHSNTLNTSFSLENITDTSVTVRYGVRFQSPNGDESYEEPVGDVVVQARSSVIEHAKPHIPMYLDGEYDVFFVIRDAGGLVLALTYAGSIEVVPSGVESVRLSDCSVTWPEVICAVAGGAVADASEVHYRITRGSTYGDTVTEGVVTNVSVEQGVAGFVLPTSLNGGLYTVALRAAGQQDVVTAVVEREVVGDDAAPVHESMNNKPLSIFTGDHVKYIAAAIPVLLLVILVLIMLRRPKTLVLFGAFAVGTSFVFAAMTLEDTAPATHIFNGLSQDSEAVQFNVTLDSDEVRLGEEIGMTVVMQDALPPNDKPAGASLEYRIDEGAWTTIIDAGGTTPIVHAWIEPFSAEGEHTISFRSSDLCGGAFGKSLFNFGIFGATECEFSMSVDVESVSAPSTPVITGDCLTQTPCTIGIVSTDSDGGLLCYEAESPTGTFENAGCATAGAPVNITRTFASCGAAETTVRAQATDSTDLQSDWGVASSDILGTIACSVACAHCMYDGVDGDVQISAMPPFLPPGGSSATTLTWQLRNIESCHVEGRDLGTNAFIEQFDWDTVRQNASQLSVLLTAPARYTLYCTDLEGSDVLSSVLITSSPIWQEF